MNKEELRNFRKDFYMNLEEMIKEKGTITKDEYNKILNDAIKKSKSSTKADKSVLVYMGSYVENKNSITGKINEYLTYDGNPEVTYKLYMLIENGLMFKININDSKKFEKKHKIIYPKVDIYNTQEYYGKFSKIKMQYYKNLLYNKQKESYKLVKSINEQK